MSEFEEAAPVQREREMVDKFRELRVSLGMSQEELSRRLIGAGLKSMNQMAVSRLEAGKRSLRFHEAVVIAEVLGQSLPSMMESRGDLDALFIQQRALEAQIEGNSEQLASLVVDTLRKQQKLIAVAAQMGWGVADMSYLMAGSLLPLDAIARAAVTHYFKGEDARLPLDFLTELENEIQNMYLERITEERSDSVSEEHLLNAYLRKINGVDPEEA